jgi:hypothetical protein
MFRGFLRAAAPPPGSAPAAFADPGRRVLSTGFLADLFASENQTRARAVALSRDALLQVLRLLAEVPDMPDDMAALLRGHRTRVQQTGDPDVPIDPGA